VRRLVVTLLVAAVVVGIAVAGFMAAADSGGESSTTLTATTEPTTTAPPTTTTAPTTTATSTIVLRVYFLREGKVATADREVPETTAVATAALTELFAGPSSTDRTAGLSSALAGGTTFHDLKIAGGVANVSIDGDVSTEGQAQIVYTLTQFSTVDSVDLDGRNLARSDFEDVTPAILVESPAPGDTVSSPVRIAGTANTFEATFVVKLTDVAGSEVFQQAVTATSGSGTRGTFDVSIPFEASPGPARLVAYEESAENGQPVHVVTIPVEVSR
jgi:hypothetical protein